MKAKLKKLNQKKKAASAAASRPAARPKDLLVGKWRITEMEMWDKEYYDEYVKAHITITPGGGGEFKFCIVEADIDGEFRQTPEGAVFDFTFLGSEEFDEVSGDGWLCTLDGKTAEGKIRFHLGDKSGFKARKILAKGKSDKGAGK